MFISMHIHKYTWHIGLRTHILRFSAELIEIGQFWLNWVFQKQKSGIFEAQCKLIISTNNRQTDRQTDRQTEETQREKHGTRGRAGSRQSAGPVFRYPARINTILIDIRYSIVSIQYWFAFRGGSTREQRVQSMPVQRAPNCEQSHGTPPGSLQATQRPVVTLTDSSTLRHRYFVVLRDLKVDNIQGGPKKRGHRLMTIIISNLNRFKNFFFTGRFVAKNLQLNGY